MAGYTESGRPFVELFGKPIVFMHEINTLPRFSHVIRQVEGILRYDRVISIARKDDVVLLKSRPDQDYLDWLHSLSLGTRNIIVLDGEDSETLPERAMRNGTAGKVSQMMAGKDSPVVSPYYGGPLEALAAEHLGLPIYANKDIVQKYDSKINFKALCRELSVPVVEDCDFTAKEGRVVLLALVRQARRQTGRAIVKGEFGASASTTYVFGPDDVKTADRLIAESSPEDRYIIEPFRDTTASPSSVWFIKDDGSIIHLKTSDQLLESSVSHAGNEFPCRFDAPAVDREAFKIAERLRDEGFLGPFGIDFIVDSSGICATECNPRMTGAIYPWELVSILERRGKVRAARSKNIHLRKGLGFRHVKRALERHIYDGRRSEGVIFPFNVGPIPDGKFTALCTGSCLDEIDSLFDYIHEEISRH